MEGEDGQAVLQARKESKEVRRMQRSLDEELGKAFDEISKPNSERFHEIRKQNNALFQRAKQAREQMDDASILKKLAVAAKNQASAVEDRSRRFQTLARRLLELYPSSQGPQTLDWAKLGRDVSKVFNPPLGVSTLYGPIAVEKAVRERAARSKRTQVNEEGAERALEVTHDASSDHNEATNARIKKLQAHLESSHTPAGIDLLELLVDPKYPTQTVENFFDMAFLVRDKRVFIDQGEGGLPRVVLADPEKLDEAAENRQRRQMVLTMNMKDLKALASALGGEKRRCPLHRDDVLYKLETAQQQVDQLLEREARKATPKSKSKRPRLSGSTDGEISPPV